MTKPKTLVLSTVLALLVVLAGLAWVASTGVADAGHAQVQHAAVGQAHETALTSQSSFAPGVVLVGLKESESLSPGVLGAGGDGDSLSAILAGVGAQGLERVFPGLETHLRLGSVASGPDEIDLGQIYRIRVPLESDIAGIIEELNAHPDVVYAEPDYLAHFITTPNDPLYAEQWGLAKIGAPAAWDVVTGSADVVIAVVDAGLDTTHPDLSGRLWTNPGEIPGNSVDDDNNGHVDDIHGWNVVNDNADLTDNTGHGTQVAGVAAAMGNNSLGVAGVCWDCRVMVVKVVQTGGVANYSDIAAGVVYAAQKGAEVINVSLGAYSDSATLRAAVAAASETAVVVAGAGNDDSDQRFYPAAYDDYVLAVAGTTSSDTKTATSNYGGWVDVSAPGEVITTTLDEGDYGAASGTSMSSPFAAGLAGLLRSQYPAWSPDMVRAQIVRTADSIDSLNPTYEGKLGAGRLNASAAASVSPRPDITIAGYSVGGVPNGEPQPGESVALVVSLMNEWGDADDVVATLTTTDTYVTLTDDTAMYGDIPGFATMTNLADAFGFSVGVDAPHSHLIPFSLHLSGNGGTYASVLPITVTVGTGVVNVSGVIDQDTVWTSDSVYLLEGNTMVQQGITLTIKPGTTVVVEPGVYLEVRGSLQAAGDADNRIIFMCGGSAPCITFYRCSSSVLEHCKVEHGSILFDSTPSEPLVRLSHCELSGSGSYYAIRVYSTNLNWRTNVRIEDNTIMNYENGIYIYNFSSAGLTIDSNVIANNDGHGVFTTWPTGEAGYTLTNNLIFNNGGYGIYLDFAEFDPPRPLIERNTVTGNGGGVSLRDQRQEYPPIFAHNNVFDNAGSDFEVRGSNGIDVTDNWWGTGDSEAIDDLIHDFYDDFNLGIATYAPFLTMPEPDAPAFLWELSISPASPVGIETVTFNLTFSTLMDVSMDPVVTFGLTEPYNSFPVVDNAQWVTDREWHAVCDISSLVPRGDHIIKVAGARGMDGLEIPTDTRFGFTVDYAGQITDQTPPLPPAVDAKGDRDDASYVHATWAASDPDSPITGYRYSIGSAPGVNDVVSWTPTTSTSMTRTGLGLVNGNLYWVSVQARNSAGLWSTIGKDFFFAGRPVPKGLFPLTMKRCLLP